MNPSERRALIILCFWLLFSVLVDLILDHHPQWIAPFAGSQRLETLLVAGRAEPVWIANPIANTIHDSTALQQPGISKLSPQVIPDPRRKLPYDAAGRLDLNAADSTSLVLLEGVGPVLAGRILMRRRDLGGFEQMEELLSVRGIGQRKLAKLLPQITLDRVNSSRSGAGPAP